ncbi:MAG: hypothetical protein U0229_15445 [Anaeromyxobacter sp.]
MALTTDRGEILHFCGRHALSPAVREGAPALAGHGDGAGRCGWARFFAAMAERGVGLKVPDPESEAATFERLS